MEYLNYIALGWLFTNIPEMISLIKTNPNIWALLRLLTGCLKCTTFWIALILTQEIYTASILSMGSYLIDLYILNKPITV